MDKRRFLTVAGIAAATPMRSEAAAPAATGPTLLTVSGAIGKGTRGALDPALDRGGRRDGGRGGRQRRGGRSRLIDGGGRTADGGPRGLGAILGVRRSR